MSEGTHAWGDADTPYLALGGDAVIRAVVERFYDLIDVDAPDIRAMLPADDSVSRRNLLTISSSGREDQPCTRQIVAIRG